MLRAQNLAGTVTCFLTTCGLDRRHCSQPPHPSGVLIPCPAPGHHVRLVGPVGCDSMGDQLVAELEQCGVDTEYSFRAGAASPRTLVLLDETGERTIIAVDSGAGPSSFLPVRGPDLRSADCVYIEGYTRYPAGTAAAAKSALLMTSPPVPGATTWPATVVVGSQTQYAHTTSAGMFEAVRSVSGKRRERVVVTRGRKSG